MISLGALDELGYAIKMDAGLVKVMKGSLLVMKGVKKNGIYSLLGNTVIGSSSLVAGSSMNNTMLWHRRPGHVSENGLLELSKQGLLGKSSCNNLNLMRVVSMENQAGLSLALGSIEQKGLWIISTQTCRDQQGLNQFLVQGTL